MQDRLRSLYAQRFGPTPTSVVPLAGDGSRRTMSRVVGPCGSAVGVLGPDPEENRAFLSFSRSFRSIGLPVPEVYAADEAAGAYLVEDLGDSTLFQALTEARRAEPQAAFPSAMAAVYRRVLEILPRFQVEGARAVDFSVAYPREAFDRQSMAWDLDYFKYHFLKLANVPFNEDRLERDFGRLMDVLLEADSGHFLYRDFQSRNVMLRGPASSPSPWFIDYQGGRRGALPYDVASLLYDAKAEIPPALRGELLERYLDALSGHVEVDRQAFRRHYRGFVLIRILQAMGAYGYRGFYERKTHFLRSVPPAVENIRGLLADGLLPLAVPELYGVLERIAADARFTRAPDVPPPGLTVHVGSFSYARGMPEDPGGHGGGFVFDCRALRNPGRLAECAARSGLDAEVAAVLSSDAATAAFLSHAAALVDAQVRHYVERGFTSLHVLFGCTGGQHRSVYLAERLARSLAETFPGVRVRVEHAERGRWAPDVAAPSHARIPASA